MSNSMSSDRTALLANVRCSESLVWFQAPGFGYTLNIGSSLELLLYVLLLPCALEILQLWITGQAPSDAPTIHRWNGCWARPNIWDWVEAELVSPQVLLCPAHQDQLFHFAQMRGGASSSVLIMLGLAHLHPCPQGQPYSAVQVG